MFICDAEIGMHLVESRLGLVSSIPAWEMGHGPGLFLLRLVCQRSQINLSPFDNAVAENLTPARRGKIGTKYGEIHTIAVVVAINLFPRNNISSLVTRNNAFVGFTSILVLSIFVRFLFVVVGFT